MTAVSDARKLKRRPLQISGTYDLECATWSIPVLGACYDGNRPRVFSGPNVVDEMLDYMMSVGGIWYGHASGTYDGLAVLEQCRIRRFQAQLDRSQHRVTRIVIGGLTLRDSYSIWPAPLDELAAFIGRPVPHLPWPCTCGEKTCSCGTCNGCGGYCRIGEKAASGDPDLEDYCIADVRVLYDALVQLREVCSDHRIALAGTLGRTAWNSAQDELGIPDSAIAWPVYRRVKRGDKGGRGAIIRPRAAGPGSQHDICSAYPAQLAHAMLPVGACRELGGDDAMAALRRARPGIYSATVNVPDDVFIPPLSWSHGGGLHFPTGELAGSWTLPELIAGLERGTKIVKLHSATIWPAVAPVFAGIVHRWYRIRREAGRRTPFGSWIGKLAKALAGVLAERPERSRVTMFPSEVKICPREGACRHGCTKRCGAYEQLDLYGDIWSVPYQKLGASSYPHWSAYLRAGTRVQWLGQAELYGKDLCMGNTDSLWTIGRRTPEPLGDGLGEWEYQHAWTDAEFPSVTAYAFRDEHGALQIRGVPGLTEDDWRRGSGVIDRGVVTFGRAVGSTGGLFQRRTRNWTLPTTTGRIVYGDRALASDGVTYPLSATRIREIAEERRKRRVDVPTRTRAA